MEVVRYSGQAPSKYARTAISFGPDSLITSSLPNGGGDPGDFLEIKLDSLASADQVQLRKFTVTTVEIFSRAQEELKRYQAEPMPQSIVTGFSVAYRGAILDLVESLQDCVESGGSAFLYSQLDCVWHFCEIMLISSHPDLPILPYFMDWIKVNFDDSEINLMKILPDFPELDPENLALLWNIIFRHTIQGRTLEASKLLEFTNQQQSSVYGEQVNIMIELMQKRPEFKPNKGATTDFNIAWHNWREQMENRLQSHTFYGSDQLTLLAQILAGKEDGFREGRAYIGNWYEYLAMVLCYQYPLLRPSSLKAYARKAMDDYGDNSIVPSNFDNILLAAMDYDILSVLRDIQTYWNHPWFPLHFSDLIYSGGIYSTVADARIDYKSVGPIRHEFVREYGIQLMKHPALWEMGTTYLSAIPQSMGLPVMAELLMRRNPASEIELEKVLRCAKKHQFQEEHQSLCRRMALSKYNQSRLQNALLWAIRAEDAQLTTTIVDKMLENEEIEIPPVLIELIPKFTSCGDRLFFLRGLCEFDLLVHKGQAKEAIVLLCRLIEQDIIPKAVQSKVLTRFRDIMVNHHNEVKLDHAQISLLLQFIHTKVNRSKVSSELFHQVNKMLLACRSSTLLAKFKMAKQVTRLQVITSKGPKCK